MLENVKCNTNFDFEQHFRYKIVHTSFAKLKPSNSGMTKNDFLHFTSRQFIGEKSVGYIQAAIACLTNR